MNRLLRNIFFSTLAFLLSTTAVWGNGGPVDTSFTLNTGNIQLVQQKNIVLDEEYLFIRFDGDYADVHVHYRFTNNGPEETVKYAFPVDVDTENEFYVEKDWENYDVPFFEIRDQERFLPLSAYTDKQKTQWKLGERQFNASRRWYATEIFFPARAHKTIDVNYRVKALVDDWAYSKSFFKECSSRVFKYTLAPSGNWGQGVVKKFRAYIDLCDIKRHGKIEKVQMPGYTEYGGVLVCEQNDFNLAKAVPIEIIYDNSSAKLSEYIVNHRVPNNRIVIRASSTLKGYDVKNLLDGDLDTAWVEGNVNNGVGEWMEVEIKGADIGLVALINGYTKSESTYMNNCCLKKVKIQMFYKDNTIDEEIVDLQQKNYSLLDKEAFYPFVSVLKDYGEGSLLKKIRLTILEVYPGAKYTDLCLSELYLAGFGYDED